MCKSKKDGQRVPNEMADKESIAVTDYLVNRLQRKIDDYTRKGDRYRYSYVVIACVTVSGSAVVPVLINVGDDGMAKLAATVLSLLVSILVGVESTMHLREHWKNYDWAKVILRREKYCFQTRSGDYAKDKEADDQKRFALLVERVENAMLDERRQTIEMRTATAADSKDKSGRA